MGSTKKVIKKADLKFYEEVGKYFDKHSVVDVADESVKVHFDVAINEEITYCALDNDLLKQVRSVAKQMGVSPEILVNNWVREKLDKKLPAA